MRVSKLFGIMFAAVTAFYVLYFVWSFFNEATIFQLIQRGTSILIFAFITYSMHAEIRSRVRYSKDLPLYGAVRDTQRSSPPVIGNMNVYGGPGEDPRDNDV